MKPAKLLRTALFPVLLPLVALGCSGGGSGGPSTTADFCMNYANAVCQIATACGVTTATCTAYQQSQCEALATKATTAPSLRVYTPANTNDCINKLNAAYGASTPIITPAVQAGIDLACGYVFQGPGMVDMDTCTTQFDCAGATNGAVICDQTHHLCATSTTISGTGHCSENGDVCSTNFYCATNTAGVSSCTAAGTSSPPTSCATAPCDSNSYCAAGTCMPLLVAGSPCTANSDCASGGYCDPYGGIFHLRRRNPLRQGLAAVHLRGLGRELPDAARCRRPGRRRGRQLGRGGQRRGGRGRPWRRWRWRRGRCVRRRGGFGGGRRVRRRGGHRGPDRRRGRGGRSGRNGGRRRRVTSTMAGR